MLSGWIFCLMMGGKVFDEALGIITTCTSLEQAKDRHLAGGATAALALPRAAKVALVRLNLAAHQSGCLRCQPGVDHLAQLVVEEDRGVAAHACDVGL